MANLLANRKRVIIVAVMGFVVLFMAYILIPSNLPKPIYIEVSSAEASSGPSQAAGVGTAAPVAGPTGQPAAAPVVYPKMGDGIMYNVGSRIVNLLDPVGRRYLKVTVVLEFLPSDYTYYTLPDAEREAMRSEVIAEIDTRKPVIDDMLTSLLTSKSYEDIYNLDGKNRLRAEIQERLTQVLGEPQVIAVYFTEFIVQ
jgi:flagellar basal body-associated protein FliL